MSLVFLLPLATFLLQHTTQSLCFVSSSGTITRTGTTTAGMQSRGKAKKIVRSKILNVTKTFFGGSYGCAVVQVVSHLPLTVKAQVKSQASPCGICEGQNCSGTGLSCSIVHLFFLSLRFHQFPIYINFNYHGHYINLAIHSIMNQHTCWKFLLIAHLCFVSLWEWIPSEKMTVSQLDVLIPCCNWNTVTGTSKAHFCQLSKNEKCVINIPVFKRIITLAPAEKLNSSSIVNAL